MLGRPAVLDQPGKALLLVAAQPLADSANRGGKQAHGRLDAALAGRFDQPKSMVERVFHLTHEIEVTDHGGGILPAARRPAPPPSAGRLIPEQAPEPSPSASSDSGTSTPPGGYDVSRLFHPHLLC